ncbi:unnamed protein product, partial [Staurois parvus]
MALCDMRLVGTPTDNIGSRGLNGALAVDSGLNTAPTQLTRDNIRLTGTQRDFGCGVWPQHSVLGTTGSQGLSRTLTRGADLSTAPTQLSRDIRLTGTQQVAMAQALRGIPG